MIALPGPGWFSLGVSLAVALGVAEAGVSVEGPHLHGQWPARASSLCGRCSQCSCPRGQAEAYTFPSLNPTSHRLILLIKSQSLARRPMFRGRKETPPAPGRVSGRRRPCLKSPLKLG